MAAATSNFSSSTQVGQGGYGKVYRDELADGTVAAIKRAQQGSLQGSKEFCTEIELLSRYDETEAKMVPFLKSSGYNVKKDVQFLPISGLVGTNMKTRVDKSVCNWWNGPCLFEVLDTIEVPLRDPKGPVRMPIIDKYKDMD